METGSYHAAPPGWKPIDYQKLCTYFSCTPQNDMWGNSPCPSFLLPHHQNLVGPCITQKGHREGGIYVYTSSWPCTFCLSLSCRGFQSALLLVGPAPHSGNPPCFAYACVSNNLNCLWSLVWVWSILTSDILKNLGSGSSLLWHLCLIMLRASV